MSAIYDNPIQYGLHRIGQVEWTGDFDAYDLTVVWANPDTGQLFIGEDWGEYDEGTPFDGFKTARDLTRVNDRSALEDYLKALEEPNNPSHKGQVHRLLEEVDRKLEQIEKERAKAEAEARKEMEKAAKK